MFPLLAALAPLAGAAIGAVSSARSNKRNVEYQKEANAENRDESRRINAENRAFDAQVNKERRSQFLTDRELERDRALADYDRQRGDARKDYWTQTKSNRADYDRIKRDNRQDYWTERRMSLSDAKLAPARLRASAESAGFNPLTLLGAGMGGTFVPNASVASAGIASAGIGGASIAGPSASAPGMQSTPGQASTSYAPTVSPLASSAVISNAIQGFADVASGEAELRRAQQEANLELTQVEIERMRAGGAASVIGSTIRAAPALLPVPAKKREPVTDKKFPTRPKLRAKTYGDREYDVLPEDNFLWQRTVEMPDGEQVQTLNTDVFESEAGELVNDIWTGGALVGRAARRKLNDWGITDPGGKKEAFTPFNKWLEENRKYDIDAGEDFPRTMR